MSHPVLKVGRVYKDKCRQEHTKNDRRPPWNLGMSKSMGNSCMPHLRPSLQICNLIGRNGIISSPMRQTEWVPIGAHPCATVATSLLHWTGTIWTINNRVLFCHCYLAMSQVTAGTRLYHHTRTGQNRRQSQIQLFSVICVRSSQLWCVFSIRADTVKLPLRS